MTNKMIFIINILGNGAVYLSKKAETSKKAVIKTLGTIKVR